jgi:hypothetical protein
LSVARAHSSITILPMKDQLDLFASTSGAPDSHLGTLREELAAFRWRGRTTRVDTIAADNAGTPIRVPVFTNEFWTSRQRAAHRLHEVSYRACFKPQLPRFFIERLTAPGDRVYDPFMGRGTTLLEAAILGRVPAGCDVNPLSEIIVRPRLAPPTTAQVASRLRSIDLRREVELSLELLVFYHPETLREICSLRQYFLDRAADGSLDQVDRWIRMVAVNRLTGHSRGFFSVYTMPPNQAVSVQSQRKINADRSQTPPRRHVADIIIRKSESLMSDCDEATRNSLERVGAGCSLTVGDARDTPALDAASVALVVTSPPFLDVVDYAGDNWLRCWFCGIDAQSVRITLAKRLEEWQAVMRQVFVELHRVVRHGGWVAFEVGEVRSGTVRLEEAVIPAAAGAGFEAELVLVNSQVFTKTANCWGVDNNRRGTNTNRVVVLQKP